MSNEIVVMPDGKRVPLDDVVIIPVDRIEEPQTGPSANIEIIVRRIETEDEIKQFIRDFFKYSGGAL